MCVDAGDIGDGSWDIIKGIIISDKKGEQVYAWNIYSGERDDHDDE